MNELDIFTTDLKRMKESLTPLLKEDCDKFIQIATNYIQQSNKLLEKNRQTLFSAIIKAAQCRLFLDGQEASLVPFRDEVKLMVGYKGLLKMIRNSGELASINAGVVYEKDTFDYYVDEKGEHLTHKPSFDKDRGAPTITYCIARTKGNPEPYIEVMTEQDVENCKKQSAAVKTGNDTPWKGPFADEMRKKTVIRRISKRLPMSTDLNMAIHSDDELFNAPAEENIIDVPSTKSSRLENAIEKSKPELPPFITENKPVEQPDKTADIEVKKNIFAQTVTGLIATVNVKEFPDNTSPDKKRRFFCKIGETTFGTWAVETYKIIEKAFDDNKPITIKYVTQVNSKQQQYNEITSVSVAEEEISPI